MLSNLNIYLALGFSLYIYLMDVKQTTDMDYMEERLKKLEEKE
jgi:hypothetical protein